MAGDFLYINYIHILQRRKSGCDFPPPTLGLDRLYGASRDTTNEYKFPALLSR